MRAFLLGVRYAVLPFAMSYMDAEELAQQCGGRLAVLDDSNNSFSVTCGPSSRAGWRGLPPRRANDCIVWQGGSCHRPGLMRYALPIVEWR